VTEVKSTLELVLSQPLKRSEKNTGYQDPRSWQTRLRIQTSRHPFKNSENLSKPHS